MRLILIITLCLSFLKIYGQDECNTAIALSDVTNWCSAPGAYSNNTATSSTFGKPSCWSNSNNDVWFMFEAVAPAVSITINGNISGNGTLNRPEIAIYSGDCTTGITEIECRTAGAVNSTSIYEGTLIIGDTYYIRIDGLNSSKGTFQLCIDNFFPPALPGQDCTTKSHLCDQSDTVTFVNLTGAGTDARESEGTCMGASTPTGPIEANTAWFTWTSDGAGTLAFDIVPTNPNDDIDFVIYEMPNSSCSDITVANSIRCMASGGGTCVGPTGLDFASTDLIEQLDCIPSDDNYVRYLDMVDGMMYGLLINNFSSAGNGFTLTFSGTGKFKGPTADFTIDKDTACIDNATFTFTDQSTTPGGSAITNYLWDFGNGANPANANGVGPHVVVYDTPGTKFPYLTITNAEGCLEYFLQEIEVLPLPDLSATVTDVLCNTGNTGAIDLSINLGIAPLIYNWSNGENTEDISNLTTGNYTVTVTDDFGCASDTTITVDEPSFIEDSVDIKNDECGKGIGYIKPYIKGGTPPYIFVWDDAIVTEDRTDLFKNTYNLTVTDDNGCTASFVYIVTNTEQPVADVGIGGETCADNFQLNATLSTPGSGIWKTSSTGITFAPDQTDPNAIITSTLQQLINLWWVETNNMCVDSAIIQVEFKATPTPDAGPDVEVCGLSLQHQGTQGLYVGQWSDDSGGLITYSPDKFTANATVSAPASMSGIPVTFTWQEDNRGCIATDDVILTFYDLPAPNAGSGGEVCDLCFDLQAEPTSGDGTWSAEHMDGSPAAVTFSPDNVSENVNACALEYDSILFKWTVDLNVCNSSDTNLVIFRETPLADAGIDDTTCILSYGLNATPSLGLGTWTVNVGGVTFAPSDNDPFAIATVSGFGDVRFTWTEINGICASSDFVDINFLFTPSIDAGTNQSMCTDSTQLNASAPATGGSGTWTSNLPGVIFKPNANALNPIVVSPSYTAVRFYWTITYPACTLVDSVDVDFVEQPIANAGIDDSICGVNYTLAAAYSITSASNSGTWSSTTPSDVFSTPTSPNSDVTVTTYGFHKLVWTEDNDPCVDTDTLAIFFSQIPTPNAGRDTAVCEQDYTLAAIASVGNGSWTDNSGGTITYTPDNLNAGAAVSASVFGYGPVDFTWTEDNNGCIVSDVVNVNFVQQPNTFAGTDDSTCDGSITLNAMPAIGTGNWSILSGGAGVFSNVNTETSNFDITITNATHDYLLVWTDDNNFGCIDRDTVAVKFIQQPVANAGSNDAICGLNYTLGASPSVGNGFWKADVAGVTFDNAALANATATAPSYGPVIFTWIESNNFGFCKDSASVTINFYETPIADAGTPDTTCGLTINLRAFPSVGNGIWTSTSSGVSYNPNANDFNAQVTMGSYGSHTFTWTESNGNGLCVSSDQVTMVLYQNAYAQAGIPDTICGLSNTLYASTPIGIANWFSKDSGVVFSNIYDSNAVVTVPDYGDFVFYWTDTNGICTDIDSVNYQFYDNPTAHFGLSNDTVYATNTRVDFYDSSRFATYWLWDFGDGYTTNNRNTFHNYTNTGTYLVNLYVQDPFGCYDDTTAQIWFIDNKAIYVPNAFTPNDDGTNDDYKVSAIGVRPGTYELKIFDRWGKLVFKSNDPNLNWNGTLLNQGNPAPTGTYTATISYQDFGNQQYVERTSIILYR
jgi:gliding motility-associated-like protein